MNTVPKVSRGLTRKTNTHRLSAYTEHTLAEMGEHYGVSMTQIIELGTQLFAREEMRDDIKYAGLYTEYNENANAYEYILDPDREYTLKMRLIEGFKHDRNQRQKYRAYLVRCHEIKDSIVEFDPKKPMIRTHINESKGNDLYGKLDWTDKHIPFDINGFVKLLRYMSTTPTIFGDTMMYAAPDTSKPVMDADNPQKHDLHALVQSNYVHFSFRYGDLSIEQFKKIYDHYSWVLWADDEERGYDVYFFLNKPLTNISVHRGIVKHLLNMMGKRASGLDVPLANNPIKYIQLPNHEALHPERRIFMTNNVRPFNLRSHTINVDKFGEVGRSVIPRVDMFEVDEDGIS
jgi:hypothetical protein